MSAHKCGNFKWTFSKYFSFSSSFTSLCDYCCNITIFRAFYCTWHWQPLLSFGWLLNIICCRCLPHFLNLPQPMPWASVTFLPRSTVPEFCLWMFHFLLICSPGGTSALECLQLPLNVNKFHLFLPLRHAPELCVHPAEHFFLHRTRDVEDAASCCISKILPSILSLYVHMCAIFTYSHMKARNQCQFPSSSITNILIFWHWDFQLNKGLIDST